MNARIPDPVQKNLTNVSVSIMGNPYKPVIIVEEKVFTPINLRYQYLDKTNTAKEDLCTILAIGYFEGDAMKYGLIGNLVSGKFVLADYNTFVHLATTDEGFDI